MFLTQVFTFRTGDKEQQHNLSYSFQFLLVPRVIFNYLFLKTTKTKLPHCCLVVEREMFVHIKKKPTKLEVTFIPIQV